MNLQEVIDLFIPFGYTEEEIRERLSCGDSVFNAYQGLKLELELRWEEIKERTSEPILLEELEEFYNRIKNIHLKTAIRTSDISREKAIKRKKMLTKLRYKLTEDMNKQMNYYLDKMENQRETNKELDNFLKELEK